MENVEQIVELIKSLGVGAQWAFAMYLLYKVLVVAAFTCVAVYAMRSIASMVTGMIEKDRLLDSLNVILRDNSNYWSNVRASFNVERIIKRATDLVALEEKVNERGLK